VKLVRAALAWVACAIVIVCARVDSCDVARSHVYVGGHRVHADDLIEVALADDLLTYACNPTTTLKITGASGVVSTGGVSTIGGVGFTATPMPTVWINTAPLPTQAKVTAGTTTSLTVTIPALAAGTYDVFVNNPGCGATTMRATMVVTAVENPSVTLGADMLGWHIASNISGSTWTDSPSAPYGQNLTFPSAPTVTTSDANFNNQTTVTYDGTATKATNASYSLEGGTTLWTFCVYRTTSATGQRTLASYLPTSGGIAFHFYQVTGTSLVANASGTTVTWPTSVATNVTYASYGYVSAPTSTATVGVMQAIGSSETSATSVLATETTPGTFGIGVDTGNNNFFAGQIAECVESRVKPSAAQYTKIYTYEQAKYAMDQAPTITASTTLPTAGGVVRIQGTNYLNGATILAGSLSVSGSTLRRSSPVSVYEATIGAGSYVSGTTYNETYDGPDNQTVTAPNLLSVASSLDPFGICGNHLVVWVRGDAAICSGAPCTTTGQSVTGATDLSAWGNDLAQSTGAAQPTWNKANANGNGMPSFHFDSTGGAQSLKTTTFDYETASAGAALYLWAVAYDNTNTAQCDLAAAGADVYLLFLNNSNVPQFKDGTFTSSSFASQLAHLFGAYGYGNPWPTGGSGNVGVNLNNGTESTASGTTGSLANNGAFSIGAGTTGSNGCKADIFEVVGCNYAMGSTDKANMETYFHNRYGSPLSVAGGLPANDNGWTWVLPAIAIAASVGARRRKGQHRAA